MYFRVFIYRLKKNIHDRELILWSLLFPILLGTFFYATFSSIYSQMGIQTYRVALVNGSEETTQFVKSTLEDIKTENGESMFEVLIPEDADEQKLLFEEEIEGIMDIADMGNIQLKISKDETAQNVLAHVVGVFRRNAVLTQRAMQDPQAAEAITKLMGQEPEILRQVNAAGENKDPYVSYMYALLAMICVMAANAGLQVPIDSQANITQQGARVSLTPVNHRMYELVSLGAASLIQIICTMVGVALIRLVFKADLGCSDLMLVLVSILGTLLGCSLGFALGHVSHLRKNTKEAILLLFVTVGGFFSGLMAVQMKLLVERNFPLLNRINPSAIIHDAFFSLNVFGMGDRFYRSLITMVVMTVVLTVIGLCMSGRRSYASI